jgi:hypothetical protein
MERRDLMVAAQHLAIVSLRVLVAQFGLFGPEQLVSFLQLTRGMCK